MSTDEGLRFVQVSGAILGVWFALVGWKLIPLHRHPRNHC